MKALNSSHLYPSCQPQMRLFLVIRIGEGMFLFTTLLNLINSEASARFIKLYNVVFIHNSRVNISFKTRCSSYIHGQHRWSFKWHQRCGYFVGQCCYICLAKIWSTIQCKTSKFMLSTHTQQATRLQFPLKLAWSMTFHQAL